MYSNCIRYVQTEHSSTTDYERPSCKKNLKEKAENKDSRLVGKRAVVSFVRTANGGAKCRLKNRRENSRWKALAVD